MLVHKLKKRVAKEEALKRGLNEYLIAKEVELKSLYDRNKQ